VDVGASSFKNTIVPAKGNITRSQARPLSELCRDGPFWPGALTPSRTFFQLLGNEVIVADLPATIPFGLLCAVQGIGSVEFSWEVRGPLMPGGAEPAVLATSVSRRLSFKPVTFGEAAVAIAVEPATPAFPAPGMYEIVAYLNGRESMQLALAVRRA